MNGSSQISQISKVKFRHDQKADNDSQTHTRWDAGRDELGGRWINWKENMAWKVDWDRLFGYKPWSDFGPLGRNRALPSCHSSMYQQRDEEPSSLERGGRAQQQETIKEKERGI